MRRVFVAALSAAMVAAAIARYPPDPALRFAPGLIGAPQAGKLAAVLATCGGLVVLDLAAYAAGRALHRRLRPGGAASLVALIERMALGFLVLAYAALALAAAHALLRPLILVGLIGLAAWGAAMAVRDGHRAWVPDGDAVSRRRDVLLAAVVAALLVSPFLAAWVPDYGFDAFAYHLALPERYLFRNRIVVTPLDPHSAFPQAVEMVYLLALSLDSGALAKLVHLQFGVLAAAGVFAMARSASARAGGLAVAILAADPLFGWEAAVAYNDLAAALFAVLAVLALDDWRRTEAAASLRLAGVFAGACVAVRYTAGVVPAAMVALVWLSPPWRAWRARLAASATLAGFATLVLAPWLVRNAVFTGNPVAPAAQSLFYRAGEEYFSPVALAQSIAFARGVGFGRGTFDLAMLPVNATLRATIGDYSGFGFRVGVLYVAGVLAFLVLRGWRVSTPASAGLKVAAIITVLWFYTAQEPRYLLPALCLCAVAGGVGLDLLIPRTGVARLLWLIPIAALVHAQWSAVLLLPYRYGYALGGLPVEGFEAQEPALAVVPALRRAMRPGDRLLPVLESRGYFYRGLDYVPASPPEVMQMIHEAPSPDALAARLRGLGITLVLLNTSNAREYRTWSVAGYGAQDYEEDLRRLEAFIERDTTPVIEERGVIVRRLTP